MISEELKKQYQKAEVAILDAEAKYAYYSKELDEYSNALIGLRKEKEDILKAIEKELSPTTITTKDYEGFPTVLAKSRHKFTITGVTEGKFLNGQFTPKLFIDPETPSEL